MSNNNAKVASPSVMDMVGNILAIFDNATETDIYEGSTWYDSAHEYAKNLAARYGMSTDVAACVIAAHSCRASWSVNMRRAELQLAGNPSGLSTSIDMSAKAIALGAAGFDPFAAITGPKINPFARNVAGHFEFVATDRWAQRAAFNNLDDKHNNRTINRKGVRESMITAYQIAGDRMNIAPAIMQAIVWVVIRGAAD